MLSNRVKVVLSLLVLVASACGARLTPEQLTTARRAAGGSGGAVAGASGSAGGDVTGAGTSGGGSSTGTGGSSGPSGASGSAAGGGSAAGPSGSAGGGAAASGGGAGAAASAPAAPPGGNGGATDVGVTGTTIEVGNVSTLSGPVPGLFKGAVVGTQAYVNYVNSLGGVFGRKLHLQIGDDALDAGQHKSQVDALVPKVFAFLGSFSVNDDAGADDMQAAGVPDVGYALSNTRSDEAVNFSPQPNSHGWRSGPLRWFKQKFGDAVIKHIAFYTEDVQSAKDNAASQRTVATGLGYQFPVGRLIEPNEANFTGDVLQMEQNGIKGIILSGDEGTMARFASTMKQQGFSVPFPNWGASAYDPAWPGDAAGGAEGALLDQSLSLYAGEDSSIPEVALFQKWMALTDGSQKTDIFSAYGWASGKLLFDALKGAGAKVTRKSLIAFLKGVHSFDDNGLLAPADPASKIGASCWLEITVRNGKFVRNEDPPGAYRCNDGPWQRAA